MSWELIESDRIIKTTELSDFINTEMMIPKELTRFFGSSGERLAIIYQNREYPSYLETEGGNAKLKWSKVLIRKLGEAFPEYESWFNGNSEASKTPRLEVTKANDVFNLRLIRGAEEADHVDPIKSDVAVKSPEIMESGLSELLKKWIVGYPNYYPRDFRFSFKDIMNEEIPKVIENFDGIKSGNYKVLGFAGDTQWAEIPWVKVTDKQLQNINDDGLYLAYILAMDSRKLYLAIVYGADGVGVRSLSEKAAEYRKLIQTGNYQTNHKEVLLANATLVSGIVCYREYTESEMPDDTVLETEFENFRKMYDSCLTKHSDNKKIVASEEQAEAPTISEDQPIDYETANSEDTAADLIHEEMTAAETEEAVEEAVKEETVEVEFEDAIPIEKNDELNNDKDVRAVEEPLSPQAPGNREDKEAKNELTRSEGAESLENHQENSVDELEIKTDRVQTVSHSEKQSDDQASIAAAGGSIEEKNAVAAGLNLIIEEPAHRLTQTFIHYPIKNEFMTPYLKLVQAKMGNKGYYYPAELIKSYYLSIKSKPFVMIKGRVGSGKTSFPRLFAEAIGANSENGRFKRVLVGKHWEDDSHLFGQLDSRGHFIPGPMMLMLKTAKEYPEKPHFLLLDEMDQSPVTDYLRLLLEGINGNKEQLLAREDFGADITAFREYGNLSFPDNLYIIGTINEGSESFPIHARVIDCGNLIKMPVVEIGVFPDYGSPVGDSEWENSQFKIQGHAKGLPEILEKLMHLLNEVQKILVDFDLSMGYRGKNEILAFGINSGVEGLFIEQEVIDLAILQRIIPALECDEKVAPEVYQALACFLLEDGLQGKSLKSQPLNGFCSLFEKLLKAEAIPCPRSGVAIIKKLKKLI